MAFDSAHRAVQVPFRAEVESVTALWTVTIGIGLGTHRDPPRRSVMVRFIV